MEDFEQRDSISMDLDYFEDEGSYGEWYNS